MEQNKLLYHFNKESDFLANQINLPSTGIAFVKDSQTIYTHEKEYNMVSWGELKIENGVYVYTNKGELIKPEEWDTSRNEEAVGVAVITDNTRMCVKKGINAKNNIPWSNTLYGTDVEGIANNASDYKGQSNTNIIIQQASGENSNNNAAHWCYAQTITVNGGTVHGYLPAIGELKDLYNNKFAVESALSLIGSETIMEYCDYNTTPWLWSSSEYSSLYAWSLRWSSGRYNSRDKGYSLGDNYALPCFPID